MPRVLLHTCCGPCTIYPVKHLRLQDWEVHGFFYNPNIHPFQEFERRLATLRQLAAHQELQKLAQQVEEDFTRKVLPIVDKVAKEKQVHFVFNAAQSGLIWADPGMDLTTEVIAALNGNKPAAPAAAPSK